MNRKQKTFPVFLMSDKVSLVNKQKSIHLTEFILQINTRDHPMIIRLSETYL